MRDLTISWLTTMMRRAREAWRLRQLARERRRIDRLYASQPSILITPPQSVTDQLGRLAEIVSVHCDAGTTACRAHGRAAQKLDAAEYAFSSMLAELRGAMTVLPTAWAPERAAAGAAPHPAAVSDAIAA